MIVTRLSYTNNGSEVDLYTDNEYTCRLLLDTIVTCKLFTDKNISQKDIEDVVFSDIKSRLFKKALNYISIRPHSKYEVTQYLNKNLKKLFSKNNKFMHNIVDNEAISEVITKLTVLNYINDEEFGNWLVSSRISTNRKSKKEALFELKSKGLNSSLAQEVINKGYTDESELELVKKLLIKKYPDYSEMIKSNEKRQKVINYFLHRGFSYSIIKEAFSLINI